MSLFGQSIWQLVPDRVTQHGILHWVSDDQYRIPQLFKVMRTWTLVVPWQLWLDMKEGRPFETPLFLAYYLPGV